MHGTAEHACRRLLKALQEGTSGEDITMAADVNPPAGTVRSGSFNYLEASVQSSLYRNGQVLTRRNRDGSDDAWEGVHLQPHPMPVHDARQLEPDERCTLSSNGFEFVACPLAEPATDFLDNEQVVRRYYPECADIVRTASGAAVVAAFDHNIRSATGKKSKHRIRGGQQVQGPARVVHGDYTLRSAPQRLRDLTRPSTSNDTLRTVLGEGESLLDEGRVEDALKSGRFAIINLWRSIAPEPVATHPLALCDAASVHPEDLVVFEIHYQERIGENYFAKHSEKHLWYFYPALTRDEALLIKQWDSQGELARTKGERGDGSAVTGPCTFSFHSAFDDPGTPPDAPDRWSIEVRCAVLYD